MDVIVTTGGTSEPIDDVRAVTNFSTGRFGVEIAAAFDAAGNNVTVLASREAALHSDAAGIPANRFGSAADLSALLTDMAVPARRCVVVHAAAVADYTPTAVTGKLSSDRDELTITMARTPKIVDSLRDTWGRKAFLVGFKLTSGATVSELHAAARTLMKRAKLNLVVSNDLTECRDGRHPVWLITQEGGAIRVEGDRRSVAARIAEFICAREDVTWSATVTNPDRLAPQTSEPHRELMGEILELADAAALLPGTDGNAVVATGHRVSSHHSGPTLFVTPRQVPKSEVTVEDCIPVVVDPDAHVVAAWPPAHTPDAKPSIDTNVQARILAAFPDTGAILHTHELWGRTTAATPFPYPCGAAEEADAVIAAARAAGVAAHSRAFSVTLDHHGFLLVGDHDTFTALRAQWADAVDEYHGHLADVGAADAEIGVLRPIIDGAEIIGVCAHTPGGGVAVHIGATHRGRGVGATITAQLIERQLSVETIDECGVIEHWRSRGFTATRNADGTVTLTPPRRRDDLPEPPGR